MDAAQTGLGATPITAGERIESLDIIRGIAVLGILVLNIPIMAGPFAWFQNPTVLGDMSTLDWWTWFGAMTFFEGTFRTMFGMLFGAGVYIFMTRVEERFDRKKARHLHFRRTLILIGFGLVDAYLLLWIGDILYLYGVVGLILWLFRRSSVRTLVIWVLIFLAVSTGLKAFQAVGLDILSSKIAGFEARLDAGETLSAEETTTYQSLQEQLAFQAPGEAETRASIDAVQGGYLSAWPSFAAFSLIFQTLFLVLFGLWDSLIGMLLGIVLFQSGFLKGAASSRTYAITTIAGYAVAVPLRISVISSYAASGYDPGVLAWGNTLYDVMRVAMALGHISLIMLAVRYGWLPFKAAFSAAGRMALTNYLMQSVIALVLFVFLGFYATLSRTEIYGLLLVIWGLQLWLSRWWLTHNKQGPLEALWRRWTYGRPAQTSGAGA